MQSITKKLLTENSLTLLKIPEELYMLLDSDHIGDDPLSTQIGNLVVVDDNHIEIIVDRENYYNIKKGPHPDSVHSTYTAKLTDSSHRDLFIFTETDENVAIQAPLNISANLVPNELINFSKFDPSDPSSNYGLVRQGAIIADTHENKDNKTVIFGLGKGEALLYGENIMIDGEEDEEERIRLISMRKLKMDHTVLKQEIVKLFRKKSQFTMKEIQHYLGQSDSSIKKALREVAEYQRVGRHKCVWTLKKVFITE